MLAKIIGVHAIEADEPVHLVELLVENNDDMFDIGSITQEVAGQPTMNWQVPYDERLLEDSNSKTRYAFFFHHLDINKPLLFGTNELELPAATKRPSHLQDIEYETP